MIPKSTTLHFTRFCSHTEASWHPKSPSWCLGEWEFLFWNWSWHPYDVQVIPKWSPSTIFLCNTSISTSKWRLGDVSSLEYFKAFKQRTSTLLSIVVKTILSRAPTSWLLFDSHLTSSTCSCSKASNRRRQNFYLTTTWHYAQNIIPILLLWVKWALVMLMSLIRIVRVSLKRKSWL
jgi:hypothetical protein